MQPHPRSPRRALLAIAATVLTGFLIVGSAAPVFAVAYESGGCVINRLSEGKVEGGSQCAGADLSGRKLGQAALQGADLTGADLTSADLQAASLVGAMTADADFTKVKLNGADLTGAGILPDVVNATAQTAAGVAVPIVATLPKGLEFGGCTIAGTPVEPTALFPVGETGVVCSLTTGQPGAGIAVVKIRVTTATAIPEVPLFTDSPKAPAHQRDPMDASTVWALVGGGALLVLGGVGAVIGVRLRRRG